MATSLTIGKKIGLGFGVVLALLAAVVTISYRSVVKIGDSIPGKILDGNLAQNEVDHLNWANEVSSLLTHDDVTELSVETDGHKCAFGKWLYGDGRQDAETLVPSIAPLLAEIEEPHAELHASAIEIGEHFKQADATLPGILAEREVDHLICADKVNRLFLKNLAQLVDVPTDPHKCALGVWLESEQVRKASEADPELARLFEALKEPHARVHASIADIQNAYKPVHPGLTDTLRLRLDDHHRWAAMISDGLLNNQKVEVEVDPTQCAFGRWLAGDECKRLCAEWPEFDAAVKEITEYHNQLHTSAGQIAQKWRKIHAGLEGKLKSQLDDHRRWAAEVSTALLTNRKIDVQTDPTKCAFGMWLAGSECRELCDEWPEFADVIEEVRVHHDKLHASAAKIAETADRDGKIRIYEQETLTELDAVSEHFEEAIALEDRNVKGSEEAERIYRTVTLPALSAVAESFDHVIGLEEKLVEANHNAQEIFEGQTLVALDQMRDAIHECRDHAVDALEGMHHAQHTFALKTMPSLQNTQKLLHNIREEVKRNVMSDEAVLAAARDTKENVTLVGVIAVLGGALLAFFIARGIIKKLTRIIGGLNDGADQVNAAAGQVSSASQQLAAGASEQASSLEETSSALEQMAAMTRTNAANAKEANELSARSHRDAGSGNETMGAISESSGQISKIIKVIEEIAFQTNLLALNAAVEAARAGEHGKGFAVVADEVRNLAQRAAQASREITGLIEDSVSRAKEGTDAMQAIVGGVAKVSELIDGIATASEEQAQGVDQVNTAVSQMDKVTQQNAAGAEESASAAEELSAQAAAVKSMVDELSAMVGGNKLRSTARPVRSPKRNTPERHYGSIERRLRRGPCAKAAGDLGETKLMDQGGFTDEPLLADSAELQEF